MNERAIRPSNLVVVSPLDPTEDLKFVLHPGPNPGLLYQANQPLKKSNSLFSNV